ncbi:MULTISPECIES: hypothetical protein [Prauserella salsuginis group]|uniref:Uncharacterized protein n=2 Tax=Prauserella salsuginis group TaxID=2893672 RepID=A0A839XEA1_9PSEU|nr:MULTISPECIES: hypothetical protein [Prauserella salsuginis group]MBB3662282.1 hypothetical protein [Prauserella sediminis]MCR3719995.1 hypothetical protein [Prauserella flava]MCR3736461.1 hypothetical protein [Prauserella salsuginis]
MLYLLAVVGAITISVVVWRLLSQERVGAGTRPNRANPVAPDDDPEFLRKLGEQKPKRPDPQRPDEDDTK